MTAIAYIFLDSDRRLLIPLAQQQEVLDAFAGSHKMRCAEVLVEQSCSVSQSFRERSEGRRLLENVQAGDVVFTMCAEWVLGSPLEALSLLAELKEKKVSLFCVDLDGDVVLKTERKLRVTEGIAPLVYELCKALSVNVTVKGYGEAIRAGKAQKKKDGKYLGGPIPFGYALDAEGRLQRDEQQQAIIAEMQNLKRDRWSYRNIAKKLEEEYGLKFSHEGVRRILLKSGK